MAVLYKWRQEKRTKSKFKGQWYARSIAIDTVNTAALADIMQQNCTVKKSDILAVIAELVEVMKQQLQDSKNVRLDGFGTFRIGLKTKPAVSPEEFNASKNVVGTHILFRPITRVNKDKSRSRVFLDGCRVQELPANAVMKKQKKAGGTAPGGSTPTPGGH